MKPQLDLVGLVVADMAASLAFYRRLDIATDADTEPHVEVALPGGMRLGFDTTDVVRSFIPQWAPSNYSHRWLVSAGDSLVRPG
jgi:catechol 2,3-dioxygenase-like lactoylglutathione lyase family enzyme